MQTSSLPIPFMRLYSRFSFISPFAYMQQINLVRATCWAISVCLTVASAICVPTMLPLVLGAVDTLLDSLREHSWAYLERRFRNGRGKSIIKKIPALLQWVEWQPNSSRFFYCRSIHRFLQLPIMALSTTSILSLYFAFLRSRCLWTKRCSGFLLTVASDDERSGR